MTSITELDSFETLPNSSNPNKFPWELAVGFEGSYMEILEKSDDYLEATLGPRGKEWTDHILDCRYDGYNPLTGTIYGFKSQRDRRLLETWCMFNNLATSRVYNGERE